MPRFEGIGGGDIHATEAISFEVWFSHDGHRYFSLYARIIGARKPLPQSNKNISRTMKGVKVKSIVEKTSIFST